MIKLLNLIENDHHDIKCKILSNNINYEIVDNTINNKNILGYPLDLTNVIGIEVENNILLYDKLYQFSFQLNATNTDPKDWRIYIYNPNNIMEYFTCDYDTSLLCDDDDDEEDGSLSIKYKYKYKWCIRINRHHPKENLKEKKETKETKGDNGNFNILFYYKYSKLNFNIVKNHIWIIIDKDVNTFMRTQCIDQDDRNNNNIVNFHNFHKGQIYVNTQLDKISLTNYLEFITSTTHHFGITLHAGSFVDFENFDLININIISPSLKFIIENFLLRIDTKSKNGSKEDNNKYKEDTDYICFLQPDHIFCLDFEKRFQEHVSTSSYFCNGYDNSPDIIIWSKIPITNITEISSFDTPLGIISKESPQVFSSIESLSKLNLATTCFSLSASVCRSLLFQAGSGQIDILNSKLFANPPLFLCKKNIGACGKFVGHNNLKTVEYIQPVQLNHHNNNDNFQVHTFVIIDDSPHPLDEFNHTIESICGQTYKNIKVYVIDIRTASDHINVQSDINKDKFVYYKIKDIEKHMIHMVKIIHDNIQQSNRSASSSLFIVFQHYSQINDSKRFETQIKQLIAFPNLKLVTCRRAIKENKRDIVSDTYRNIVESKEYDYQSVMYRYDTIMKQIKITLQQFKETKNNNKQNKAILKIEKNININLNAINININAFANNVIRRGKFDSLTNDLFSMCCSNENIEMGSKSIGMFITEPLIYQ